jgi:hypothetical protein
MGGVGQEGGREDEEEERAWIHCWVCKLKSEHEYTGVTAI